LGERNSKSRCNLSSSKISRIQQKLITWGKTHYAIFPWRSSENDFHALVAEIMLQRTKAEQVVSVYSEFVSKYREAKDVSSEDPVEILRILKPLGLTWRAKKIVEFATELDHRGNIVPKTFDELIVLPGIGTYATCAFLSFHSEIREPIVDTNVIRLWTRVFGLKRKKEMRRNKGFLALADKITPAKEFKNFNYAILDHTRTICKRIPLCKKCPISFCCDYFHTS